SGANTASIAVIRPSNRFVSWSETTIWAPNSRSRRSRLMNVGDPPPCGMPHAPASSSSPAGASSPSRIRRRFSASGSAGSSRPAILMGGGAATRGWVSVGTDALLQLGDTPPVALGDLLDLGRPGRVGSGRRGGARRRRHAHLEVLDDDGAHVPTRTFRLT